MSGYASNQTAGLVSRDHGWHGAGHTSKQHGYAASANQWSTRGSAASTSDWSGRGSGSAAAPGGSSFVSSTKNVMGMAEPGRSAAASAASRATHDVRYDAYKQMATSATRRY